MDLLHRLSSLLHCRERLPVDIGRFDGVDLLLQSLYLCNRLFYGMLMRLLAPQGSLRRWLLC